MLRNKELINVLIVDDDVKFVNDLYETISSMGYNTTLCVSSKEADSLVLRRPFHIFIIDCLMPEMDGYALGKNIKKYLGPDAYVVLMSAVVKTNSEYITDLSTPNILNKPFNKKLIKEELERAESMIFNSQKSDGFLPKIYADFNENTLEVLKTAPSMDRGDVLILFYYLLQSNFEGTLQLSYQKDIVNISMKNKMITDVFGESQSYLIQYFTKNNLVSEKDMVLFKNYDNQQLIQNLVDSSLISPHHLLLYKASLLTSFLKNFSKKIGVEFKFLSFRDSEIQIHPEQIKSSIKNFIENDLPPKYLKKFVNEIKTNQIVIDKDKKSIWISKSIPNLYYMYKKLKQLSIFPTVDVFLEKYQSNNINLYSALFWSFSQRLIKIKDRRYMNKFEKIYISRYESLYDILKVKDAPQIFEFLGCQNVQQKKEVQNIYYEYIKNNHPDIFVHFSKTLQDLVEQTNATVTTAYEILESDKKMKRYKSDLALKKTQSLIEIENLKQDISNLIIRKKYKKAIQKIHHLQSISDLDQNSKHECLLFKIIIQIEQSNFSISAGDIEEINSRVEVITDKQLLLSPLYLYTMGMVMILHKNLVQAKEYFNRALKTDPSFYLARTKTFQLKDSKFKRTVLNTKAS